MTDSNGYSSQIQVFVLNIHGSEIRVLSVYRQASKIQINGAETPPLCNKVVPQIVKKSQSKAKSPFHSKVDISER